MCAIKTSLFFLILFCGGFSFAQVIVNGDNEFDKKYTPGQNSVFNELHNKNKSSATSVVEIKNSLKFCPTLVFRQKIVFFYEREITKGLSLNIGGGKSFGADIFEALYFDIFSEQAFELKTLSPGTLLTNSQFNASSALISAGIRVYFDGTTFDGAYVDLNYRIERIDYTLKPIVNGNRVEGLSSFSFKTNAFFCGFGYASVSGRKGKVTHDFFMNFGIKFVKYTQFDEVEIPGAFGNTEQVYRKSAYELSARILPALNMGYSLGFGF